MSSFRDQVSVGEATTTTTRRPGRPKDQAKRDAILDAGWALFLERGVGAVSIEAIAARAGVSKMTVYNHFTDKHALFEDAVRREMRAIETAQARERDENRKEADLESVLRSFGLGIMSFLVTGAAVDFYNVLAGELRRHPALALTFYQAGPARTIENLAVILTRAGDRLAIDDPKKAAEALFGLWQGASNFQLSLGVDADRASTVAARVDYGVELFIRAFEHRR